MCINNITAISVIVNIMIVVSTTSRPHQHLHHSLTVSFDQAHIRTHTTHHQHRHLHRSIDRLPSTVTSPRTHTPSTAPSNIVRSPHTTTSHHRLIIISSVRGRRGKSNKNIMCLKAQRKHTQLYTRTQTSPAIARVTVAPLEHVRKLASSREEGFYVKDVSAVVYQLERWKRELPGVRPFYGIVVVLSLSLSLLLSLSLYNLLTHSLCPAIPPLTHHTVQTVMVVRPSPSLHRAHSGIVMQRHCTSLTHAR